MPGTAWSISNSSRCPGENALRWWDRVGRLGIRAGFLRAAADDDALPAWRRSVAVQIEVTQLGRIAVVRPWAFREAYKDPLTRDQLNRLIQQLEKFRGPRNKVKRGKCK